MNQATTASTTNIDKKSTLQINKNMLLPCIEQPTRVILHCNGHYVKGSKNVASTSAKRSEKDEFRLTYEKNENGIVKINNHKYGSILVVVTSGDGTRKVAFVQDENSKVAEIDEEVSNDFSNNESSSDGRIAMKNSSSALSSVGDNAEEDERITINISTIKEQDKQWYFVKYAKNSNKIILKSWSTGDNLGIINGKIIFASDYPDADPNAFTWNIECVTGELCYISNPKLDCRVRSDLNGMIFLTDAWKGWEVFRFMEASHGYVKISSWMHSQWLLCSSGDGTVNTCSYSESLLEDNPKGRCSKWAIEKSDGGVTIRSKTFGRLLSFHDGILKTYDPGDNIALPIEQENTDEANADDEETLQESAKKWWNTSLKSVKDGMKSSKNKMQKEFSRASIKSDFSEDKILQKDTTVWQLEAAHLQTYFFINAEGSDAKSIGPFPQVSSNLRKTDKIRLDREMNGVVKLCLYQEQYIACMEDGTIELIKEEYNLTNEWIMEKPSQEGGTLFRSKLYNYYLSYKETIIDEGNDTGKTNESSQSPSITESFNKLFKSENQLMVIGTKTKTAWRLEPSMPRAVSSQKIKTFALGTSIAVGTTIAMPFALAGMGALIGAMGAEVGIVANVIAVGLTGAEALASVGAIGATAYIVFRAEENSLSDDHDKNEEEGERAWSKRPFSNWRNW